MPGNHTWVPLLTVQEYDLAGLYIGCLLQDLFHSQILEMQTDVVPWLRNQRFNNSMDGIAMKRGKK